MRKGLFRKISAAAILAAAFTIIIPASFAKMSDFAGLSVDSLISGISNTHGDGDSIRVGSDGDDIVITNQRGEEIYRIQDALPLLPASERRLIESSFEIAPGELEKILEAYTS